MRPRASISGALCAATGLAITAAAARAPAQPAPPSPASTTGSAAPSNGAGAASSPQGPVHLSWVRGDGAESCPPPAALAAAVVAQLGRDPFAADAARSIEAVATREGGRFVARIYVRDPSGALTGAREISSDDATCAPLGAAAALAIALAIDPDAALRPRASGPPPAPPPPAPAPPRPCPAIPAPRPRAPSPAPAVAPVHAAATARIVGAVNLLPAPAPGFAFATDARIVGPLRWTAGLAVFPEVRTPAPDDHFAFGLATASLGVCVQPFDALGGVVSLAACGTLQAGVIHAVVLDVVQPTTPGDRPFVAATLGVRAAFRVVGPLRLEVGIDGLAPLVRHVFTVAGRPMEPAFTQPILAGIGYVGAGVHFW